jgi:hypothetical protein
MSRPKSRTERINYLLARYGPLDRRITRLIIWHASKIVPLELSQQSHKRYSSDPTNKWWTELLAKNSRYHQLCALEERLESGATGGTECHEEKSKEPRPEPEETPQ